MKEIGRMERLSIWIDKYQPIFFIAAFLMIVGGFMSWIHQMPKEFHAGIQPKLIKDFNYFQDMHTEAQREMYNLSKRVDLLSDVEEQRVRLYDND